MIAIKPIIINSVDLGEYAVAMGFPFVVVTADGNKMVYTRKDLRLVRNELQGLIVVCPIFSQKDNIEYIQEAA